MNHLDFDWDDENIGHIAKHQVTPEEVEQVLINDPLDVHFDPDVNGEERWTYLGETNAGRILNAVITIRGDKIRVVTAYEAERTDRLLYLQTKADQS
ncbi:MAG TPA: BrnT family toxin [Terracidiphilus sp.]|nr:BrnT family toxin [Terracidiphilus sp.]